MTDIIPRDSEIDIDGKRLTTRHPGSSLMDSQWKGKDVPSCSVHGIHHACAGTICVRSGNKSELVTAHLVSSKTPSVLNQMQTGNQTSLFRWGGGISQFEGGFMQETGMQCSEEKDRHPPYQVSCSRISIPIPVCGVSTAEGEVLRRLSWGLFLPNLHPGSGWVLVAEITRYGEGGTVVC